MIMANLIRSERLSTLARAVLFALVALNAAGASAQGTPALLVAQSPATSDRAKEIAAADAEIRVARGELEEARRRFEAGRKATSTDRVNQLEGGGPYTDAYHLRVEQLKTDVVKAQQRLDRAITARKAIGE
jgi:spore coat polysaccharide biosynthesis protein SpsF (cytidylyltransferase family)